LFSKGRIVSETAAAKKAKGTVFVRTEVCKGCSYCIDFCPTHCLSFSSDFNAKGYHFPVLSQPENCTGCDMCGQYCPDFAIFGMRLKDLEEKRAARAQPSPPGSAPAKE
jgi:2-oxoglutarate ferredoxin oxidoreductase subunit delta